MIIPLFDYLSICLNCPKLAIFPINHLFVSHYGSLLATTTFKDRLLEDNPTQPIINLGGWVLKYLKTNNN